MNVLWILNNCPHFAVKAMKTKTTNSQGWLDLIGTKLTTDPNIRLTLCFPSNDSGAFYSFRQFDCFTFPKVISEKSNYKNGKRK